MVWSLSAITFHSMATWIIHIALYEQKVVIVHQSEADVPMFPELVHVYEDVEIEKV